MVARPDWPSLSHPRGQAAIARLSQTDREKSHRQRRRHSQLNDEASLIDALRSIQRVVGDDLIGRGWSCAGEGAPFEHPIKHLYESAIDHAPKSRAVWLEHISFAQPQRLSPQK